jgi:large subunit ribosomal protein L4
MATQTLVRSGGGSAGEVELDPAVFEAKVLPHLFHAEVRRQLARRRAGTHSTKNRAAVSGGGIKPWRQKGTGRARQGTIRAPQWAGGGIVFGPVPRNYEHALPKKVRRAALRGALSLRVREGALVVADALDLSEPKTKLGLALLAGLGLDGSHKVLVVIDQENQALERGLRNLSWVTVIRVAGLNTYDVLRHPKLLTSRAGVAAIQARLAGSKSEGEAS